MIRELSQFTIRNSACHVSQMDAYNHAGTRQDNDCHINKFGRFSVLKQYKHHKTTTESQPSIETGKVKINHHPSRLYWLRRGPRLITHLVTHLLCQELLNFRLLRHQWRKLVFGLNWIQFSFYAQELPH